MTARKTVKTDAPAPLVDVDAVLADAPEGYATAPTPESAAHALGMRDGKGYRRILRGTLGVYVSRGGAWDARTRAYALAVKNASGDARDAIVAEYHAE